MKSIRFPKQFRVYAPLIAVFLVLVFVFPKTAKFTYDYKKGSPWMSEDLVAQFDFPVLKSDFQIQQERDKASEQVIPYYRQNLSVLQQVEKELADIDLDSYPGSICRSYSGSSGCSILKIWYCTWNIIPGCSQIRFYPSQPCITSAGLRKNGTGILIICRNRQKISSISLHGNGCIGIGIYKISLI